MIGRTILGWIRDKAQPEAPESDFTTLGDIRGRPPAGAPPDARMSPLERLFRTPNTVEELASQVEVLRSALMSAIQDIAVLKELLREKGGWDDYSYRKLRIQRMVKDHSSAGPWPHPIHSYYPYVLNETDFLKEVLSANEAEVREFEQRVDEVRFLT